MNNKNLKVTYL